MGLPFVESMYMKFNVLGYELCLNAYRVNRTHGLRTKFFAVHVAHIYQRGVGLQVRTGPAQVMGVSFSFRPLRPIDGLTEEDLDEWRGLCDADDNDRYGLLGSCTADAGDPCPICRTAQWHERKERAC